MARLRQVRSLGVSDCPFADHFWIAGLDSRDLLETYRSQIRQLDLFNGHVDTADHRRSGRINEDDVAGADGDGDGDGDGEVVLDLLSPSSPQKRTRDSWHRLSKLSDEARRSIQSINELTKLHSNRSSATIRVVPRSSMQHTPTATEPIDFDAALKKFASDRDAFQLSLSSKDGQNDQSDSKSRMQPQSKRNSAGAAIRIQENVSRHVSFRELKSTKRQPSVARRTSTRNSRRMSNYNAVVPTPNSIVSPPNEHPLKRTFEPALLDRYPRSDTMDIRTGRKEFPQYMPMFAFPNDIQIVSSDDRPPSTWHEFTMTGADNARVSAVCVTVWLPMDRQTADELERLCDSWRRANLTNEERELAASLAERLAIQRAQLSRLLARLPTISSDSGERIELEDTIGAVEEKINLMSEMLKPLRHGAANKIEGLTDGDSGLWIPRAYGLVGQDASLTAVWKEWLKAVVVPMMGGAISRIPPSSPRTGMWQPLERYVHNMCCEAVRPSSSTIQIDLTVRELHLYAKKEAINELPGGRNTDLYPLFRALTIENVVILLECVLAEARIILVSSYAAVLQSVSKALLELIWPLEWAGVYVPVLPARLVQVLEAPCPYICGVVRKGGELHLPEDDYILVDLDIDDIAGTEFPPTIPKQQRRKLTSLLHQAAPHHHSRGVPVAPPLYSIHTFPNNMFASEHTSVFSPAALPTNLGRLASLSSTLFGSQAATDFQRRLPILNAMLQASPGAKSRDRPPTAVIHRQPSHTDSDRSSPRAGQFAFMPPTPACRNEYSTALQTSLRDKRSGHVDNWSKHSDNFSSLRRKASLPFVKHSASASTISFSPMDSTISTYAPSSYAQSTLAASTIMPGLNYQPALNTETTIWMEGHCMQRQTDDKRNSCAVCAENIEGNSYRCSGCQLVAHGTCAAQIPIVCQSAFYPDQIRAAFARLFASLFYSYRKFVAPADAAQRKLGAAYKINVDAWSRSLPHEHAAYLNILRQTQAFHEFVAEREHDSTPSSSDRVLLFDALIMAKRGRAGRMRSSISALGRSQRGLRSSSGGTPLDFMADTAAHVWRVSSVHISSERPHLPAGAAGRDYHTIVSRAPAKLEDVLFDDAEETKKQELLKKREKASLLRRMNGLSMNAP